LPRAAPTVAASLAGNLVPITPAARRWTAVASACCISGNGSIVAGLRASLRVPGVGLRPLQLGKVRDGLPAGLGGVAQGGAGFGRTKGGPPAARAASRAVLEALAASAEATCARHSSGVRLAGRWQPAQAQTALPSVAVCSAQDMEEQATQARRARVAWNAATIFSNSAICSPVMREVSARRRRAAAMVSGGASGRVTRGDD
jgi:hypothetical protein